MGNKKAGGQILTARRNNNQKWLFLDDSDSSTVVDAYEVDAWSKFAHIDSGFVAVDIADGVDHCSWDVEHCDAFDSLSSLNGEYFELCLNCFYSYRFRRQFFKWYTEVKLK